MSAHLPRGARRSPLLRDRWPGSEACRLGCPGQVRRIPPHRGWAHVAPAGDETRHNAKASPACLWDLRRRLQGTLPGPSGHSRGPTGERRRRLRHEPRAPRTGSAISSQQAFHTAGRGKSVLPAGSHLPAWSEYQKPGIVFYSGLSGVRRHPAMVKDGRVEVSSLKPSEPGFTCTR